MKFMMLMLPGPYENTPEELSVERLAPMTRFNEELQRAGVLVDLNGLHPQSSGARVSFKAGKPTVTDGPFAESKEVLGGYWVIDVESREAAIEWASQCPGTDNEVIEIRQIQEMEDFGAEAQDLLKNSYLARDQH